MSKAFTGPALVSRGALPSHPWALEDVTTGPLQDDELVVKMCASGICHTDLLIGSLPADNPMAHYPRVLGHEGSGHVVAVGPKVNSVAVGDPVLLSYASCRTCGTCKVDKASYCAKFAELDFMGRESFVGKGEEKECSVVNVKGLVDDAELELYAPLGCGIQTGAGTVINAAKPTATDIVCVTGLGGVGLSAIMGAAICKPKMIVGVDRVESRLQLAKELEATHVLNTDKLDGKTLVEALQELCEGMGPHMIVETTGAPPVINAALEALRLCGTMFQVGAAPPDFELKIQPFGFILTGKSYRGVIEGEASPPEFVPKMIKWHREGRFPIDRLIKKTPAKDFAHALEEMHSGATIKPVLVW